MESSVLSVTVIEARELKSTRKLSSSANPYVLISLGDEQKQSTESVIGSLDPVWNEIMSFDITTGKEVLVARVFDRSETGSDSLMG